MQKSTFNKATGDYSKATKTKPAQAQTGKEPDPAGARGERASADAATSSTPKAGAVTPAAQDRAKE